MKNLHIDIAPTDINRIIDISRFTFEEAWLEPGQEKDLYSYMDENFNLEKIEEELVSGNVIYMIIHQDQQDLGYLKLELDANPDNYTLDSPIALHRFYVKAKFRNDGIGARLMDAALDCAFQNQCKTMWLGVWNENIKAMRFYQRYGFEIFGNYQFIMGTIVSDDFLMKKIL